MVAVTGRMEAVKTAQLQNALEGLKVGPLHKEVDFGAGCVRVEKF